MIYDIISGGGGGGNDDDGDDDGCGTQAASTSPLFPFLSLFLLQVWKPEKILVLIWRPVQ